MQPRRDVRVAVAIVMFLLDSRLLYLAAGRALDSASEWPTGRPGSAALLRACATSGGRFRRLQLKTTVCEALATG